jgi:hypothetical protein
MEAVDVGLHSPHAGEEVWKPVVGYEALYSVSSVGRVRRDAAGKGARAGFILRPSPHGKSGYLKVGLLREGVQETRLIHRLVAEAFVGPRPLGLCVNHKDDNKLNNVPGNLEWVTLADNTRLAFASGLHEAARARKLNPERVREVRRLLALGLSESEVAVRFGVARSTVGDVRHRRIWADVA